MNHLENDDGLDLTELLRPGIEEARKDLPIIERELFELLFAPTQTRKISAVLLDIPTVPAARAEQLRDELAPLLSEIQNKIMAWGMTRVAASN